MDITMKTLVTFVLTILFIASSVHCYTTVTANTPDIGIFSYPIFNDMNSFFPF